MQTHVYETVLALGRIGKVNMRFHVSSHRGGVESFLLRAPEDSSSEWKGFSQK